MPANDKAIWDSYKEEELHRIQPILMGLGFVLDPEQPHIQGERYLMSGAQSSGEFKLILTGHRAQDNTRVVIKASSSLAGMQELLRERHARETLHNLNFAQRTLFTPKEVLFVEKANMVISISEFVDQRQPFTDHPLNEQFFLALKAFEAQEGIHATTFAHTNTIRDAFGMFAAAEYIDAFEVFKNSSIANDSANTELAETLQNAAMFLHAHKTIIERYSGFLTHTDFAPHNLRVSDNAIYLLDHTSICFGNKYEGWARFINFMTLHNPPLEHMLIGYIQDNRGPEEYLSLRLMRIYKLGFLLQFYTGNLAKTAGDLHSLTRARIQLWTHVLKAVLEDIPVDQSVIAAYIEARSLLRSKEETRRQQEIGHELQTH